MEQLKKTQQQQIETLKKEGSRKLEEVRVSNRMYLDQQFQQNTETRHRARLFANRAVADRAEVVLNNFLDIGGYFRAGFGRDDNGGAMTGFIAPGALAKYRLGNEAENFGEAIFSKSFFVPGSFALTDSNADQSAQAPSQPIAKFQFRVDFFNEYENFASSEDTNVGLPEAWASIGNVLSRQPSAKFWAGNRFYRRRDIGLNDFFIWNISGGGAGVEDIAWGQSKLAFAWIGTGATSGFSDLPQPDPANQAGFSKTNLDMRLYELPLLGGELELGLTYAWAESGFDASGVKGPHSTGYAINLVHTTEALISGDGFNTFALQYGTQAAKTFTSGFETFVQNGAVFIRPELENSWRLRLSDEFTATLNEHFSMGAVFIYQDTDYRGDLGKETWLSAGVRPIVHFNKFLSLAFEAGVDNVRSTANNTHDSLYKFTIAPQISLGNRFNSRPTIRLFATWASWGDDFKGQIGGNDYANETQAFSFGVQTEAWW